MEQIGTAAGRSLVMPGSRSVSDPQRALQHRMTNAMPVIINPMTDIDLPRHLWDPWRETGKPRCVRRSLTDTERRTLTARAAELEPWVIGYHPAEEDDVSAAIGELLSSFPSNAGHSDEQAVANIKRMMNSMAGQPKWAIERACDRIRVRGYTKATPGGGQVTERHWPPSDSELLAAVEHETALYKRTHQTALELLAAPVAEHGRPR